MRVTVNMMSNGICNNISETSNRLLKAENVVSSDKKISEPSDDVSGTGQALRLQSAISDIGQYNNNCTIASGTLSTTSSTLSSIVTSLQSVRNLTSEAANSSLTDSARSAIVSQLDQLSSTLLQYANTQQSGSYIFSGSDTKSPALTASTSGTAPYSCGGNSASINMQIAPGTSVTTNVTADQVFNIGSCAVSGTADVFSMINNIEQAVTNGDTTTLSSSLSDVDANLANVTTLETQVGATASRVTSAETSLASTKTSLSSLLSQTTDADYTQAVIDLQTEENVYQAATSTASSVLKLSLVNFFS
jgi:flagellar hook-associated protein 3 FlgL